MYKSRLQFAIRTTLIHLSISVCVALLSAFFVFGLWYPAPWRQLLGAGTLFALIVVVDMVSGPLLTGVLANPKKSTSERWADICLVGALQLLALAYGVWTMYVARPVVLVFEADRFVVVTANEVQIEQLPTALPEFQRLPLFGLMEVSLREAKNGEELLNSVVQSLAGVPQSMRPNWWVPIEQASNDIVMKSHPIARLVENHPGDRARLENASRRAGKVRSQLRYLPLASSKSEDWIVLLDEGGRIVGYEPINAFK